MVVTNERVMRPRARPELILEWVLFASRWILAPLYLSMVSMLAAIFVVFPSGLSLGSSRPPTGEGFAPTHLPSSAWRDRQR
jgi:hypothetical protein